MDVRWGQFEWDQNKARTNLRDHGVSFADGALAFYDPNGLTIHDIKHSTRERREWLIAMSSRSRVLLVVFTERDGARTRLISVRHANKKERTIYETQNK